MPCAHLQVLCGCDSDDYKRSYRAASTTTQEPLRDLYLVREVASTLGDWMSGLRRRSYTTLDGKLVVRDVNESVARELNDARG